MEIDYCVVVFSGLFGEFNCACRFYMKFQDAKSR